MPDISLKGKTIVLGVTGGIAAYKMPNVAHALVKLGADVHVLMTKNATEFIAPLVFETLTNRRCIVDTFDRNFQYDVAHVSLANSADLMLIAPATANVLAKLAHGLADDMLTTVTLAAACPKLVAPAMNTHMLENPITQDNLKTLEHYGFTVIPSGSGLLACGDVGSGRLPEESVLVDYCLRELACANRYTYSEGGGLGGGPPASRWTRCGTSPTTPPARWGCAVAKACMLRGADVTLLCARDAGLRVPFVKTVPFTTAGDLFEAVKANAMDAERAGDGRRRGRLPPRRRGRGQGEKVRQCADPGAGAHRRHPGLGGRAQAGGAVPVRLLDGDAGSDRELHRQAAQKEPGPDRGKQP